MLKRDSKTNLNAAANAVTYAKQTVIPKKEELAKCLLSFVQTAAWKHKFLSNQLLIAQYIAVSATNIIVLLANNINSSSLN